MARVQTLATVLVAVFWLLTLTIASPATAAHSESSLSGSDVEIDSDANLVVDDPAPTTHLKRCRQDGTWDSVEEVVPDGYVAMTETTQSATVVESTCDSGAVEVSFANMASTGRRPRPSRPRWAEIENQSYRGLGRMTTGASVAPCVPAGSVGR